jgi:hypothetical protein
VGQIAQTIQAYEMIKSTTEISRMDPIEKIGIVLEGTLPKLPVPIAKEFAAFLLTIGVTRLAVILAGWAASHFVGVGEVIDIFLGAAFAIGCLLTGWALADGVGTMIDATNDAVDAQNQRDLDAASTKMAKGIETLGVALISLALVRGIKTGAGGKVSGKSESSGLTEQRAIGSDRRVRLQARWEAVQQKARAERTPEAAGRGSLSGEPTEIPPGSDAETSRSLARENESANSLAKNGYSVEQNPKVPGLKRPDYKIDGEIFDCYSPSTDKVRNIASSIDDKVQSGQAQNVVVNLKDSSVTSEMLNTQISNYPIDGLKRLIIIDKDGVVAESLLRGN